MTNLVDGDALAASSRSPQIMGDAAVEVLTRPAREASGHCYVDADVLTAAGGYDLADYGGGDQPIRDLFLD